MKEHTHSYDQLIKGIKPTPVEPPAELLTRVKLKIKAKKEERHLSLWQYAAAVILLLINSAGIYFYTTNPQEASIEIDTTEQMASDYNWDSNYYNY